MGKITDEDVININKLYIKYGTYNGVANELGISPATVKKYIIPDFKVEEIFEVQAADTHLFDDIDDFADMPYSDDFDELL